MGDSAVAYLCGVVFRLSGIVLGSDKAYLVESRLLPVARKHGFHSLDDLARAVQTNPGPRLVGEVVDAMTTNETYFFRDQKPFDQFRRVVLPHLAAGLNGRKEIRVWCAACSTGQEPYSLQMVWQEEAARYPGVTLKIVASDLSAHALERARLGIYSQFEVQRGLPIQMLLRFFTQHGDNWEVKDSLRQHIDFRPFNLLDDYRALGRFDFIACRNVLIYFNEATKRDIVTRQAALLNPKGVYMTGSTESLLGFTDRYTDFPGERGIYILKD